MPKGTYNRTKCKNGKLGKYHSIFVDHLDKDMCNRGTLKYSAKERVCKWKGCKTILNGYSVGSGREYCHLHYGKAFILNADKVKKKKNYYTKKNNGNGR